MPPAKRKKPPTASLPSKPAKQRKRASRMWLWWILICFAGMGISIVAALYIYADRLVVARLASRSASSMSAIYSDMFELESRMSIAQLQPQLDKRRYIQVENAPESPGEYQVQADHLIVITRAFVDPRGQRRDPQRITVPSAVDGNVKKFFLEPQIISALGTGEIRANEERRLNDFPPHLINAVIAIEDERFFHHFGIDLLGIARALWENVLAGRASQGGSTLTQQLAKNLFFSPEKTIKRKVLEAFSALSLERHFSKQRILEMYLNEVYLGQEGAVAIHGMGAAARSYFGKELEDLSVEQAALLAGLIQAPSSFSPRRHAKRAQDRRDLVINKMKELKFITDLQAVSALSAPLVVQKEPLHRRRAPHFVTNIQQTLASSINMEAAPFEGLRVYTGLDPDLQACAERAVKDGIPNLEKKFPKLKRGNKAIEIGIVSIEPFSGKVRAWIGGKDFSKSQFDHVSQARRQIGSTIKPFLYLTALDKNLNHYRVATPISILTDEPIEVDLETKSWTPENYDKEYRGDVTLRYALEHSLNIPAVQIVRRVGVNTFVHTLENFHVSENIMPVPSLALGALDTTLLNLTSAFGALANGGVYVPPRPFLSVLDQNDTLINEIPMSENRVADEAAVFVLTDILQGVIARGTGQAARSEGYQGPAAAKTGTSNEARDAWFIGYTPDLVTGVWMGFDDNQPIGLTGGQIAAPIWGRYMKCVSELHPPSRFVVPPGVVFVAIDPPSGRLATSFCPSGVAPVKEVFVQGTEPIRTCEEQGFEEKPHDDHAPPSERDRPNAEPTSRPSFWERLFG